MIMEHPGKGKRAAPAERPGEGLERGESRF